MLPGRWICATIRPYAPLANRGYFPVHRGEMSLSLAMTDEDISGLIDTLKSIVSNMEPDRVSDDAGD